MAPDDPKSEGSIEEIESIRDILFGQQAKQTESRLQEIEDLLIKTKKELQSENIHLRKEFEKKLADEQAERQKTVLKLLEALELERTERRQEEQLLSEQLQDTRKAFSQSLKRHIEMQIETLTNFLEQSLPAEDV